MRRQTCPPEYGELRPIGPIAAEVVADLRFRRKVVQLLRLGPQAVGEFWSRLRVIAGDG